MNKQVKVTSFDDSGHGWLRVKRAVLEDMGILAKVSHYSYERGASVYLEEDCDATLFFNRAKELELDVVMKAGKWVERSPIRSYNSFSL